jgi:hypothetical protein
MRGSEHSTDFRTYDLSSEGASIGKSLIGYHGITTGIPEFVGSSAKLDVSG